jgi:hypothetical protein
MQKPLAFQRLNIEEEEEVKVAEVAEEVIIEAMEEVVEELMAIRIIISVVAEVEEEDTAVVEAAVANSTMKVSNGISRTLKVAKAAIK